MRKRKKQTQNSIMDTVNIVQFILSFGFVLGLIMLIAWGAKKTGLHKKFQPHGEGERLAIIESLSIDAKHRLLLIKCDKDEYLLMVGGNQPLQIQRVNAEII